MVDIDEFDDNKNILLYIYMCVGGGDGRVYGVIEKNSFFIMLKMI